MLMKLVRSSRFVLAALIACCLCGTSNAAGLIYGSNPAAGSTFVSDGARLYYESYGQGVPVLLLHGNGGSIASFKEQIGELSAHHHVIAMDSRGQGRSELHTARLTYEQMAEDANALLDHLGLRQVRVLGWSDGGIIGLLLAIHHPDKVAMLAVLGANVEPDGLAQWAIDGIVRVDRRTRSQLLANKDSTALQTQLQLLDLMKDQPHITPAQLSTIVAPTLVMAADRDAIRDTHTLAIFHSLRNAQLVIFPGATHLIHLQDPVRFNRTVLEFFDKPFAMPDTKDLGFFD